jgi:cell division septal protein FtsQ
MKKKNNAALLGLLFLGLIFVAGGWLYSRTALFRLSDLVISVDDADIEKSVKQKMISYLGRSLFSVSLIEVEAELKEISRIEKISLTRVWPQTLKITLSLKKAFLKVRDGTDYYSVDIRGDLIEKVAGLEKTEMLNASMGLIEITGAWNGFHKKWLMSADQKKEILTFVKNRYSEDESPIDFLMTHTLDWNPQQGLRVFWGDPEVEIILGFDQFEKAWSRVKIVWQQIKDRRLSVEFLDATYQNRVVARTRRELQNSEYRLNLEELVRRGEDKTLPATR